MAGGAVGSHSKGAGSPGRFNSPRLARLDTTTPQRRLGKLVKRLIGPPREHTHTSCVRLVRHENIPALRVSDWSVWCGAGLSSPAGRVATPPTNAGWLRQVRSAQPDVYSVQRVKCTCA
eukprot:7695923-Pyramimonas_sp.AAC.1